MAITPSGYRLPNARRKRIHECFSALAETDLRSKVKIGVMLQGVATEDEQVGPGLAPLPTVAVQLLREAMEAA